MSLSQLVLNVTSRQIMLNVILMSAIMLNVMTPEVALFAFDAHEINKPKVVK